MFTWRLLSPITNRIFGCMHIDLDLLHESSFSHYWGHRMPILHKLILFFRVLMKIGDRCIHFKAKVTLILCVFSSSDVRSNRWLLYSLLHSITERRNRLIWDISSSCTGDGQLSAHSGGGAKVRRSCQSTLVGGACTEQRHTDRTLRTAWFQKRDLKKTLGGFLSL